MGTSVPRHGSRKAHRTTRGLVRCADAFCSWTSTISPDIRPLRSGISRPSCARVDTTSSCSRHSRPASVESRGNPSHRGGAGSISSFAIEPPCRAIVCCDESARSMPAITPPNSPDQSIRFARSSKAGWTRDSTPSWFRPISCTTRIASHWARSVGVAACRSCWAAHISTRSEVAREWMDIPGLSALVGGEIEPHLCELVRRVIGRESTADLPGVWSREGEAIFLNAPPLADLDRLPFPDYSQFPWSKYPNTIVPIITGRGCGWGVCTFCSDVTSTVGRTFRSRSPETRSGRTFLSA